ncbi:MAG: deoxynucleoside kinase [Deltaproteobacteria bacterium]|nr:deoxynucleoside kinase [Deltaproteobacteria bacterium]
MDKPRYIVVEGPIGVGKTTLVEMLIKELDALPVYEAVEQNPFLEKFYEDRVKYAFQTQLFFLLSRYQQQREINQPELFRRTVVSDYLFAKDRIFAFLNLSDDELSLYEQVFRMLDAQIPRPDLVIYMQASSDVLEERIALRGKFFERHITREYLDALSEAYANFFFHYADSPLLTINTSEIDFVKHPEDFALLVKEIKALKRGAKSFVPQAGRKR